MVEAVSFSLLGLNSVNPVPSLGYLGFTLKQIHFLPALAAKEFYLAPAYMNLYPISRIGGNRAGVPVLAATAITDIYCFLAHL